MQLTENAQFGRYTLTRLLGRGGFSEVWLARDPLTNLDIAIKIYAPGYGMDSDGLKEFSQELAHVFNLNHTNLLKPTHVDAYQGMPYLIMPYCSDGSILRKAGSMPEPEVWKMVRDVAAGLAYLHKQDIVHQDIKPDNILHDSAGNYVITDFGISTRARSTLRKSMLGANLSGGTMAYMGPERFSRQPAPTKASDVWSLGAMTYEMLTGDVPFGEMGGGMQKSGAEIPEMPKHVSKEMRDLVEQMLALETWDRPTAEAIVSLCDEVLKNPDDNNGGTGWTDYGKDYDKKRGRETQGFNYGGPTPPPTPFTVTPDDIKFTQKGGKSLVKVTAPGLWTATCDTPWVKLVKKHDDSFEVHCQATKVTENLNATITVTCGTQVRKVKITQEPETRLMPPLFGAILVMLLLGLCLIVLIKCLSASKPYFHSSNTSSNSYVTHETMQLPIKPEVRRPDSEPDKAKIEQVIERICANRSKRGNKEALKEDYASYVSPYYKDGISRKNTEIPQKVREFLCTQDSYEIYLDVERGVTLNNNTFPCEVIFNSHTYFSNSRRGKCYAYSEVKMWFNSDYKITGYIETWTDEKVH